MMNYLVKKVARTSVRYGQDSQITRNIETETWKISYIVDTSFAFLRRENKGSYSFIPKMQQQ